MNTALVAFLALLAITDVNALSCPIYSCVAAGGSCAGTYHPDAAFQAPVCNSGLYCNSASVCAAQSADGTSCNKDNYGYCVNSCVLTNASSTTGICGQTSDPGSSCQSGQYCLTPSGYSLCPSSLTCPVQYAGQSCVSSSFCNYGLFCNFTQGAGTCIAQFADGSSCTTGSQCVNICSSGTCVHQFSVAIGQPCTDNSACVVDSYCSSSGGSGVCTAAVKSSNKACNVASDCGSVETCTCLGDNSGNAQCVAPSPSITSAIESTNAAFATCYQNNINNPTKCNSQECAYLKASYGADQINTFQKFPCVGGSYSSELSTICATSSAPSMMMIASPLLLVVVLFLTM